MLKNVLIIVGPTAVGKTETTIQLAKILNGEIISGDSMQIYKYMNIGTAKPNFEEMQGIKHYLIDIIDPKQDFSVAEFQKSAREYINEILNKNKLPILTGGTGLYINSLIYNMDFTATISNWELRRQLEQEAKEYGNKYIHNKLKEIDPVTADRIHQNNLKRVIRAIEVNYENGEKIGDFSKDIQLNHDYNYIMIGLTRERAELYDRINKRVDKMIEQGLVNEVKNLIRMSYEEDLIAFKGLGYKEIIAFLKGNTSLDESIKILKRDTRRYAKRQLTWFKRYKQLKWFNLSSYEYDDKLVEDIIDYLKGYLG